MTATIAPEVLAWMDENTARFYDTAAYGDGAADLAYATAYKFELGNFDPGAASDTPAEAEIRRAEQEAIDAAALERINVYAQVSGFSPVYDGSKRPMPCGALIPSGDAVAAAHKTMCAKCGG